MIGSPSKICNECSTGPPNDRILAQLSQIASMHARNSICSFLQPFFQHSNFNQQLQSQFGAAACTMPAKLYAQYFSTTPRILLTISITYVSCNNSISHAQAWEQLGLYHHNQAMPVYHQHKQSHLFRNTIMKYLWQSVNVGCAVILTI